MGSTTITTTAIIMENSDLPILIHRHPRECNKKCDAKCQIGYGTSHPHEDEQFLCPVHLDDRCHNQVRSFLFLSAHAQFPRDALCLGICHPTANQHLPSAARDQTSQLQRVHGCRLWFLAPTQRLHIEDLNDGITRSYNTDTRLESVHEKPNTPNGQHR